MDYLVQLNDDEITEEMKRNILNKSNLNESKFLSHLEEIIKSKNTNAENILNKFTKNKDLINFDEK